VLQNEEEFIKELSPGVKTMKTILTLIALVCAGTAYCFYHANKETQKELARIQFEKQIISISREKEEEMAPLKIAYSALEADFKKEINEGQIKIVRLSDRMSIILVDKILFTSGEAVITPEGSIVLERVGNVLKNTPNEMILIDGYTDTTQETMQSQNKYSTIWALSTARAANVMLFLQEKVGIEAKFLDAIEPSGPQTGKSNESQEDFSQESRIEIVLLPHVAHQAPLISKQLSMR
jgi:chemotaxis protein MotB